MLRAKLGVEMECVFTSKCMKVFASSELRLSHCLLESWSWLALKSEYFGVCQWSSLVGRRR